MTHLPFLAVLLASLTALQAAGSQTPVEYPDRMPAFSWDRVPLYAHLSIGDGLKPEQYDFLADHFDLITFQAGGRINGKIETNIAAGARAIKQRNPRAKVLFYWSCDLLKRPWKGLLTMLQEARQKMGRNKLMVFNPLHGDDGIKGPLGEQFLPVTDGAMMDDFDRAPDVKPPTREYLAAEIEEMRKVAQSGKIIVFKGWPGFTWWSDPEMLKKPHEELHRIASQRITFPLACFLVAAERNSYFCYTWGWLGEHGSFDWYPEFDKPLGPPKSEAERDGWTYRREFEHAMVFVDLENKEAQIDWKR